MKLSVIIDKSLVALYNADYTYCSKSIALEDPEGLP